MPPNMTHAGEENNIPVPNDDEGVESIPRPVTPTILGSYSNMDCPQLPPKSFRVGIVTMSLTDIGGHVFAISNPASPCVVSAVCTLDTVDDTGVIEEWCQSHHLCSKSGQVVVGLGKSGFERMMHGSDVDAVYLALPYEEREEFLIKALDSKKHVLVDYPIAMSVPNMMSSLQTAHRHGLNLQDSTKFIHHHRVKEFLGRILDESFTGIKTVTASLNVTQDFLDKNVREANPLVHSQGCIATLARYCVVFGVLVFYRVNRKPVSVQVTRAKKDETGMPIEAFCIVNFDNDCSLIIDCSYINTISVRQHVEVDAGTRSASMINFVFPHHSLASYLLYEKDEESSGKKGIKQGDCIDLAGGPPKSVMLWRKFAELSRSMEQPIDGECRPMSEEVLQLSYISVQSHAIVLALMKSIDDGCTEVQLDPIDVPSCWR